MVASQQIHGSTDFQKLIGNARVEQMKLFKDFGRNREIDLWWAEDFAPKRHWHQLAPQQYIINREI